MRVQWSRAGVGPQHLHEGGNGRGGICAEGDEPGGAGHSVAIIEETQAHLPLVRKFTSQLLLPRRFFGLHQVEEVGNGVGLHAENGLLGFSAGMVVLKRGVACPTVGLPLVDPSGEGFALVHGLELEERFAVEEDEREEQEQNQGTGQFDGWRLHRGERLAGRGRRAKIVELKVEGWRSARIARDPPLPGSA